MRNPLSHLLAVGPELAAVLLTTSCLGPHGALAAPAEVPSPNLDLSQLGRVAVAGDFDSVSVYQYQGQNENAFNNNGSESILMRFPNGALQPVGSSDASIQTMCPFYANNTLQGVIVGGNFTSLGGVEAQGIALWNPNTTEVTALPGLSGSVNAVLCDQGMVYVGGMFMGGNSTNALAWTTGWTNLPFAGFNGPVSSITKSSSGKIVFAGQFEGLGNASTPKNPDVQVVNLGSGDITAVGSTTQSGLSDPRNIICKTGAQDGPGNTWLLDDHRQGYWQGAFHFGFNPTKLRLYNTKYQGRGTKTFYFEELNSGGVLNLNYIDAQGNNQSCSSRCPLPQNNETYQDFHFAPSVGMNWFRVFVAEWYGDGGGLAGIELFQDDIYSFAVNDFNEPKCDGVSTGSSSTVSPTTDVWKLMQNNGRTTSDYLTASLAQNQINANTNVVFKPNLKQSGNYSITMYTPGCIGDGTCANRGEVQVNVSVTTHGAPTSTTVFQNNYYDKFDQIYYGYVDADGGSFQPSVTLSPKPGQNAPSPLTIVAQRIRFELITSTGGLNGLFEYDPTQAVVSTDFSKSAIDTAGAGLNSGAVVNQVVQSGDTLFAAGSFIGNGISNIISVKDKAVSLPGGGLNAAVQSLWLNGSMLYVGGNFTSTVDKSVQNLNNLAAFDIAANKWSPLGNGVAGTVTSLVPVVFNVTQGVEEECLTVNGEFTSVNGMGSSPSFNAQGFAVWVPSLSNWLHNVPNSMQSQAQGQLTAYTTITDNDPMSMIYAGDLTSNNAGLGNAVELVGSGRPTLESLGVRLTANTPSSGGMSKRALANKPDYSGVYNGIFYHDNGLNITILAGHFGTQASGNSNIENLVFINNTDTNNQVVNGVSGIDANSTFMALDFQQTLLFAGGSVTGKVNNVGISGLIIYDLVAARLADTQPPALLGRQATVNTIAARPKSTDVFVGGNFSSAGSLPCASLCFYDTAAHQWNSPGAGLTGDISKMTWASNDQLIIVGNLTVGGNATMMATYDANKQTFQQYSAANAPGPISAFSVANSGYDEFWAAGTATNNGSAYLAKYSNNAWTGVGGFGVGTVIRGLQVMTVTSNHNDSALVPSNFVLLITGNININGFGNASACLFDGTSFQPFILTHRQDGSQGSMSNIFVGNPQNFMNTSGGHLALGLVVLIGLAISLGIIFLMVVAGILIERYRRRREGYIPMSMDKNGNLERIPPETLLGDLGKESATPRI